jgi:hypothetical protein
MQTSEMLARDFAGALLAAGPHPDLGDEAHTYGQFAGSWSGEYRDTSIDGTVRTGAMEVHFGWVLRGRAVQDVWIARTGEAGEDRRTYGTTLRVYDPELRAWRVTWNNPPRNGRQELIGRRVGDDIVQTGYFGDRPGKWVFTDITPDSFTWNGYSLDDDGVTWHLETEFKLRRLSG